MNRARNGVGASGRRRLRNVAGRRSITERIPRVCVKPRHTVPRARAREPAPFLDRAQCTSSQPDSQSASEVCRHVDRVLRRAAAVLEVVLDAAAPCAQGHVSRAARGAARCVFRFLRHFGCQTAELFEQSYAFWFLFWFFCTRALSSCDRAWLITSRVACAHPRILPQVSTFTRSSLSISRRARRSPPPSRFAPTITAFKTAAVTRRIARATMSHRSSRCSGAGRRCDWRREMCLNN
jgi:hypothetical protein